MLCFPNAKINIGLYITEKRPDGYHTIESIFYPIPLRDALEVVVSPQTTITLSGLPLDNAADDNLVMKAYTLMAAHTNVPTLAIYLKKAIPSGAGLGGGSADAAFMLHLLNTLSEKPLPEETLLNLAEQLGADCPFFIRNKPAIVTGTGNLYQPAQTSLKGYTLCIVKPPVSVSTKEAYSMVKPKPTLFSMEYMSTVPVREWKSFFFNDFEPFVFRKYPIIQEIKDMFYAAGAAYASMTGSGSAVYGIFQNDVMLPVLKDCFTWKGFLD